MVSYTLIFMGFFFMLSCVGLLWFDTYHEIISNEGWFMMYTIFIGWWVALVPVHELYEQVYNEDKPSTF